ncbi:hypothetical protein HMPREF0373_01473 [Eubacterium ramulus ATCC 29099]|uniref:Uncharacterized protein n=1 Tax=Eubacterium ramulus ATCC 29099 TaxID=1256908 RepID=U2PTL6_EUBRA|nr:hypothetical protein HMPREF0373_01473 [Eubacterium ramulus ATCC 29099]
MVAMLATNDDKKNLFYWHRPHHLKRVDKTGNPQYKMIFFFFWMFL